jgi:uncharacterized protein (UPF0332 family)
VAHESELAKITRTKREKLLVWQEGAQYALLTGLDILKLCELACVDRIEFATWFLEGARYAVTTPSYRLVLNRSYYAMYHAARAVVFFVHGGDDHERHSELPSKLPKDFPNRPQWESDLTGARVRRNEADYGPYPKDEAQFSTAAQDQLLLAERFLPLAVSYLRIKGVPL